MNIANMRLEFSHDVGESQYPVRKTHDGVPVYGYLRETTVRLMSGEVEIARGRTLKHPNDHHNKTLGKKYAVVALCKNFVKEVVDKDEEGRNIRKTVPDKALRAAVWTLFYTMSSKHHTVMPGFEPVITASQ